MSFHGCRFGREAISSDARGCVGACGYTVRATTVLVVRGTYVRAVDTRFYWKLIGELQRSATLYNDVCSTGSVRHWTLTQSAKPMNSK